MKTTEIAKRTITPYFIEYVNNNGEFYYQLVRTRDEAILYSNEEIREVAAESFAMGLSTHDVTIY